MRLVRREMARGLDFAMCYLMNRQQKRHRLNGGSLAAFRDYLDEGAVLTPEEFFAAKPMEATPEAEAETGVPILRWKTPRPSGYAENDRAHALLFLPHRGGPTVLMLHALASTSDKGYRQWAQRFNARGWNACFVHLPYHYSKVPVGYRNGELAITPDLVRTGEGLRQGVVELRQLMSWLRGQGVAEFGLWATSYGGWIGALLLGVERDFRFAVLQAPIANVAHAIWESGAARHMRRELMRVGITQAMVERHAHLTAPMKVTPACGAERVILAAGRWDQLARARDIEALHRAWAGSTLLDVEQGHFGFQMAEDCFQHLVERGYLGRAEAVNGQAGGAARPAIP